MELYRRQGETAAIYVQAALSKLLHAPQELASPLRVRLGTTDAQGPGPAVELSSDLLGEVDALRRERSLLMDELALTRSELWVTRDRLGRQLRSWPGRFLIAYWSTVSRLVPYGSRRRLIAKRIRSKVRALLRGSAHGVRIGPSRSPAQPAAGAYQPTGPPMPAEPVRLSAADPDYAVLVDRTEPSDRKLRSQWESALAWIAPGEIELVTEVRGSSHEDLWRTFQSIQAQSNPHWRWRLILAPSVSGDIRSRLRDEAGLDLRLRVRSGPSDYSSAANLKAAFEACEARFIALLRTGDLLAPHALYRVAEALRRTPQPDIVYSDADRFVPPGLRADPLFKPDWSPETMLSVNLLENLLVFDRGLLDRVGLPDLDMGTAWLVDFALRLAGRGMRITHLPEVLLHVADSHEEFPARGIAEALERSRGRAAALRSHLRRQGLRFPQVEVGLDGLSRATWGLSRDWRVSLIIPTKESREVLERCVDSLTKRTDYGALELIIVDTGSRSPGIMAYYRSLEDERGVIVEHMDGEFNFGKTCNRGAARASGDLLLFLNNDTEALHPDWLLRMIQWFEIDGIGVVGAKLLYPDGRIQHAGVIVGMGGLASHVFLHSEEGQRGIFGSPEWYRDYSAVTGACMMVRREAFEFVGGFDEEFVVNYSDVDLCLRIRNSGWRIVYTPDARLLHHESYSHQRRIPRRDFERASELWSANGYLQGDPYFNSSLSYMNPRPDYRRMESDNPSDLNKRLMRRLPRKVTLTLPDDVA
jgi:GT2 family glycosyltransferase